MSRQYYHGEPARFWRWPELAYKPQAPTLGRICGVATGLQSGILAGLFLPLPTPLPSVGAPRLRPGWTIRAPPELLRKKHPPSAARWEGDRSQEAQSIRGEARTWGSKFSPAARTPACGGNGSGCSGHRAAGNATRSRGAAAASLGPDWAEALRP